jgi:hypothetical protein
VRNPSNAVGRVGLDVRLVNNKGCRRKAGGKWKCGERVEWAVARFGTKVAVAKPEWGVEGAREKQSEYSVTAQPTQREGYRVKAG